MSTALWILAAVVAMGAAPLLWGAIAHAMARDLDTPPDSSVPEWWRESRAAAERDVTPWPSSLRPAGRLLLVAVVLVLAIAASAIWPMGLAPTIGGAP
jgi:cytochrome b